MTLEVLEKRLVEIRKAKAASQQRIMMAQGEYNAQSGQEIEVMHWIMVLKKKTAQQQIVESHEGAG